MDNSADLIAGIVSLFFFGFMALFWLFWMTFVFGGMIFWIYMLVDVAKREFPKPDDKTVWILVVALTGVIGALIYYFAIKRPASKKGTQSIKT